MNWNGAALFIVVLFASYTSSANAAETGGKPEKTEAIAKYAKIEEPKMLDDTYDAFAPYWAMTLAVRAEAIQAQFAYLDKKEFPQAKNADPKDFFDNSFVDTLARTGLLSQLGMSR